MALFSSKKRTYIKANEEVRFYPNCDSTVWLRSCEQEIVEPISGEVEGKIPSWLNGCLLRNGPGSLKVGAMEFSHLFDSSALLHKFGIKDGTVTYQCRFVQTNTYKRNKAAQRIVVTEFGTKGVPDPCHSILHRISSIFKPGEAMSDNSMISVYPFGDEIYAFGETPIIHRINSNDLDTCKRRNISKDVAIINHTSHPHVMPNGDVYNVGMTLSHGKIHYAVVHFSKLNSQSGDMFKSARIVAKVPARWALNPGYMHTFGITDNFFVIVEQPLSVSLFPLIKAQVLNDPLISCFRWFPEHCTRIYLLKRSDGSLAHTFRADAFFYLHIINQYEEGDQIILDICCYKDPSVLNAMYVDSMKTIQSNMNYSSYFRNKPLRFILPLKQANTKQTIIEPTVLCVIGCETPTVNYEKYCGRKYRYFYAIGSDVDVENPGIIIKVDTTSEKKITWYEKNCYPSEPVFVQNPESQEEDDGILLSALVWGHKETHKVGLLVLDAKTLKEIGRVTFQTPSAVPKCLHGWYFPERNTPAHNSATNLF